MRLILPPMLPWLLLTPAYTQSPTPLFLPAPGSPLVLEGAPVAARAGDLNNDGKMDLLVILSNPVGLQVLPGDGAGRFKPAQPQHLDLPFAPGEIVLAEFNADGNLDLAAVTHDSYDVLVLWATARAGFPPPPGPHCHQKGGPTPTRTVCWPATSITTVTWTYSSSTAIRTMS